jgi:hypothetical protein
MNGRVTFIRLNLKDCGLADVGIISKTVCGHTLLWFICGVGTHPWNLFQHLHTPCRLGFNTSWVSCPHWAADRRPVWFVPLWRRLGERGEGAQLCIHRLTEAKNVSVFVYFLYLLQHLPCAVCLSGSPTRATFSMLLSKLCLAAGKVKFGNSLNKLKYYSGRN